MKHNSLKNKNIIITGAVSKIGLAIAREIAKQGANIILVDRDKITLQKTQKDFIRNYPECRCGIFNADLGNSKQVQSCVKYIKRTMGKVNGLIVHSEEQKQAYLENTLPEEIENLNRRKYLSATLLTRHLIDSIEEHGFISYTSSITAFTGIAGLSAETGPNIALIGFAESLWMEMYSKKIGVSVLCLPPLALLSSGETKLSKEEERQKPPEIKFMEKFFKSYTPEMIALHFLQKLKKQKFIIIYGLGAKIYYRIIRIFPMLMRALIFSRFKGLKKSQRI